ncbi:hypothetical protein PtB15_4B476 [Puccinia triticina]|nr:hypothetical protein PtB15_4B476 [Puccinia triticina]
MAHPKRPPVGSHPGSSSAGGQTRPPVFPHPDKSADAGHGSWPNGGDSPIRRDKRRVFIARAGGAIAIPPGLNPVSCPHSPVIPVVVDLYDYQNFFFISSYLYREFHSPTSPSEYFLGNSPS